MEFTYIVRIEAENQAEADRVAKAIEHRFNFNTFIAGVTGVENTRKILAYWNGPGE